MNRTVITAALALALASPLASSRCDLAHEAEYDHAEQDWRWMLGEATARDQALAVFCGDLSGRGGCDLDRLFSAGALYAVRDGTDPVLGIRWSYEEPCHNCTRLTRWSLEWKPSPVPQEYDGWLLIRKRVCAWDA